uniref:MADF domain-containing protein n=1 Tax=Anoplophora glabripennis TaxID=217634 RepID=V5GPU9_ANOGL
MWKNLRGSYTKHLKTYVPSGSGASAKRPYYLSEYISFVLPFTKSRQPKGNVEAPKNNEPSDTLDEETFTEDQETEELEPEQLGSPNEVGNYKNNHGRKHDSDDEQSITEDVNQDVSDVILSQQDSLEKNDCLNSKQGKQKKSIQFVSTQ